MIVEQIPAYLYLYDSKNCRIICMFGYVQRKKEVKEFRCMFYDLKKNQRHTYCHWKEGVAIHNCIWFRERKDNIAISELIKRAGYEAMIAINRLSCLQEISNKTIIEVDTFPD